jgi:uncharacterized protein (UPF0248 family)
MQYILDLLNRIRWDKNLNPDEYSIVYEDRVDNTNKQILFKDIKRIEGTFIIIEKDGEEINIPIHRIRQVKRNGKSVWKREVKNQ